MNSETTS